MSKAPNKEVYVEVDDGFVTEEIRVPVYNPEDLNYVTVSVYLNRLPSVLPTLCEAWQHWEELGLPKFEFDGVDGFYIEEIPECEELDRTWYLAKIHMQWQYCKFISEHVGETFNGFTIEGDLVLDEAMALGALCREYQLSRQHRDAVLSARDTEEQRRQGGKMRAHPMRAAILSAMTRRILSGQSVRQAAHHTFVADGLGKSATANASLWNRAKKKVQPS